MKILFKNLYFCLRKKDLRLAYNVLKSVILCRRPYKKKDVPDDFIHFHFKGEGSSKQDYLVTPHTRNLEIGYLYLLDYKGNLKNYIKLPGFAYAFRKFRFNDDTVWYAYLQVRSIFDLSFENCELVILDEELNVIKDNIYMLPYGSLTEKNHPVDQHEYVIFGKNHFMLACVDEIVVDNIPNHEGENICILNTIIQEQKNGKVIWQWELKDHLDLLSRCLSYYQIDNFDFEKSKHLDCMHLNSIDFDKHGNLLLSCFSIGLVKISRKDGSILWTMGKYYNDIEGLDIDKIPKLQHHARYHSDGSITIFDNVGNPNHKSRICKYWIDEVKMKIIDYKEYESWVEESWFMGNAKWLGDETYAMAFGGDISYVGFEEYDFKRNKRNAYLYFDKGHSMYQIFVGEVKIED